MRLAPFLHVERADRDRVLAVNFTGPFFLARAAARLVVEQGTPGRIVNASSVHTVLSESEAVPFTARKGSIEAMRRTPASELAPNGITVNCVRPGATGTAMSDPLYTPDVVRALHAKIPLGRIAPPE